MRLVTLGILALAAALTTPLASARASDRHPWCMIVQDRDDGWACGFDAFAQCLAEARAGNTGFCIANPSSQAPTPARPSHPRRKPR